MKDKDKGEISEMIVASELIKNGYTVSRPLNDGKYDLLAEKDRTYTRVQVKSSSMHNGCVRAALCEYTGSNGAYVYDKSDIDVFAIYNESHGCFFLNVEEAPQQLIHIRVKEPEVHSDSINYAEDFRIGEIL